MSDTLRSYLASEVVKEEVIERHSTKCPLGRGKANHYQCHCVPEPYERIVIERPVGLVVEAKEAEDAISNDER